MTAETDSNWAWTIQFSVADQWPCRWCSAWTQPRQKLTTTLGSEILQGNVATLFRWSCKILSYFVANLSETLHINFYQNRSSIVEVIPKKLYCVFMPLSVDNHSADLCCPVGCFSLQVSVCVSVCLSIACSPCRQWKGWGPSWHSWLLITSAVCLSVCLCLSLSVCLYVCVSVSIACSPCRQWKRWGPSWHSRLLITSAVCLSVCLCLSLSVCLYVCMSVYSLLSVPAMKKTRTKLTRSAAAHSGWNTSNSTRSTTVKSSWWSLTSSAKTQSATTTAWKWRNECLRIYSCLWRTNRMEMTSLTDSM